jgi:hypothetical protein
MLRRVLAALVAACLLPAPAFAWGFAAHREITRRAIDILPPPIRPFFVAHGDELVYRSVDPDLWRTVGWDEDHNHFVNFGAPELGPAPFTHMPREYDAALEKFGRATLDRLGTLPWREAEMFGNLERAFADLGDANQFAAARVTLFAAAASHYVQDATQPLHAANNYDGQLTGQRGVHARFETELFERFEPRLAFAPGPLVSIASPRDFAFDTLLGSYAKVDALLAADKAAAAGREAYDDAYFEAFFAKVKPMMEERLSAAVTATASIIAAAWEAAGRPSLAPKPAPAPRRVRRAR